MTIEVDHIAHDNAEFIKLIRDLESGKIPSQLVLQNCFANLSPVQLQELQEVSLKMLIGLETPPLSSYGLASCHFGPASTDELHYFAKDLALPFIEGVKQLQFIIKQCQEIFTTISKDGNGVVGEIVG